MHVYMHTYIILNTLLQSLKMNEVKLFELYAEANKMQLLYICMYNNRQPFIYLYLFKYEYCVKVIYKIV